MWFIVLIIILIHIYITAIKDIIGFGAKFFSKKVNQNDSKIDIKKKSRGKVDPLVVCGPSGAGMYECMYV